MSELHEALGQLGPIDWADVPQETNNLSPWMKRLLATGELICNSVPPPPGGTDYEQSQPTQPKPDTAKSAKDVVNSDARPVPPHPEHESLQKSWGKPIKLNAKDNPLGISVYKMAAKDRHGAWFARRQVLEGISITKIRKAMQREFAESLGKSGGPGAGNVRGIGGDRRLEKMNANDVGKLEALQLSAQFPGPTTPREFITLLLTSENALSSKTSQDKHAIPRHFMVISKPLTHPDASDREGYVKGHYESVELIREIPLHPVPEGDADDNKGDKHELNPVEWIMITRSDPGGGIPRFMVERGTPGSIAADVSKFLDWACPQDDIPDPDADEEKQQQAQDENAKQVTPPAAPKQNGQAQPAQQGGILASLTGAVEAGIEAYAPASVANYTHNYMHPEDDTSDSSSSSDSSDAASFASARDHHDDVAGHHNHHGHHHGHHDVDGQADKSSATPASAPASPDTLSRESRASTTTLPMGSTPHDKELRKLDKERAKIEAKIHKKQDAEAVKLATHKEKDPEDMAKYQEKHDAAMAKLQEKREKELAKLEHKREKEIAKAQRKRSVQLNRDETSRVARERDDFRNQVDMLKRENNLVREQMADLQRENAILVEKINKLGGVDALRDIKSEVGQ